MTSNISINFFIHFSLLPFVGSIRFGWVCREPKYIHIMLNDKNVNHLMLMVMIFSGRVCSREAHAYCMRIVILICLCVMQYLDFKKMKTFPITYNHTGEWWKRRLEMNFKCVTSIHIYTVGKGMDWSFLCDWQVCI